jgi:hypothetical protein
MGDSCTTQGQRGKRGRTGQVVAVEQKVLHVDELTEFRGDRPCQRGGRTGIFRNGRLVYESRRREQKRGVPVKLLLYSSSSVRLMSPPNSVGIDPASANEDVRSANGRLASQTRRDEQMCVPVRLLSKSLSVCRLTSSPNSVGIDPAIAKSKVFVSVVYHKRQNEQTGTYPSNCCYRAQGQSGS